MKYQRMLLLALVLLALSTVALFPAPAVAVRPPAFEAELAGPDVSIERTPGHYIVIQRSTGHYLDPGAVTNATGTAHLMFLGPGVLYRIMVSELEQASEVSLRLVIDRNGQVFNDEVAVLWSGRTAPGAFSGRLAGGWLTDRDVGGPLSGQGLAGLQREMSAGNIYMVVHTLVWPKGEIGGPVVPIMTP